MLHSPALVGLTLGIWFAVSAWSFSQFHHVIPAALPFVPTVALTLLYLPWMATWLWTIHNLVTQSASALLPHSPSTSSFPASAVAVAVVYTTCDDFDPDACLTALRQDYLNVRLVICDDSRLQSSRDLINEWVRKIAPKVAVVRRQDRSGFKAGNLNFGIATAVSEEFIVLCDADEALPPFFVSRVLAEFAAQPLAFVQCRHSARLPAQTWLEDALGPAIDIFYRFTLPMHNRYGFVACFGHGLMLRRSAWKAIGGFPEIACEDLGFALRVTTQGLRGRYVDEPVAHERFPSTYAGLAAKYRRIVAGTIECFRSYGPAFLRSKHVSLTEKLDFLITFSTCYLPFAVIINVTGALALAWAQGRFAPAQQPGWLLLLYMIGPLTPVVPLLCRFSSGARRMGRFALIGSIAYASLAPQLAFVALRQTLRPKKVRFVPTGVMNQRPQNMTDHVPTCLVGLVVISLAAILRSDVSAPAVSAGLMFMGGPLLSLVDHAGVSGWAARRSALIPYGVLVALWWAFR
jgi:hypothetical protein